MRNTTIILKVIFAIFFGGYLHTANAAEVHITNAWLKESIPGSENGAGYFTVENRSDTEVVIVGAATEASRAIEIHQHIMRDGMMRMTRVPELSLAPRERIVFQPGGYHLMLFGVKNAFKVGDQVEFTLKFSDGSHTTFEAEVKSIR